MKSVDRLTPKFAGEIPEPLQSGLLYVSFEHGTMLHLCACGCGNEVVLPLSPADWRLTYDGQAISVWPSVGNWSLPCRSHYVIERGRVNWADDWTDKEIEAGRLHDRKRQAAHFSADETFPEHEAAPGQSTSGAQAPRDRPTLLSRLRSWFS